jgi:hypothetical protein
MRGPIPPLPTNCPAGVFLDVSNAEFLADFCEVAVSIIMKDQRSDRLKHVGIPVGAVTLVPLKVAQNDQIEESIII